MTAAAASNGAPRHNPTVFASAHNRYRLQEVVRAILPGERVCACQRGIGRNAVDVPVMVSGEKGWYRGLIACGSVWVCPVCSFKVAEHRQERAQLAIDVNIERGGSIVLVTNTVRHGTQDRLADLLPQFAKALRRFKSGRAAQDLRGNFGLFGEIRGLEVTHGRNGWHPHTHAIMFADRRIEENLPTYPRFIDVNGRRERWTIGKGFNKIRDANGCWAKRKDIEPLKNHGLVQLKRRLFSLWYQACQKENLPLPTYRNGVDVRPANYAGEYVAKWGFAPELTKAHLKAARRGGRSAWQLLAAAADGDKRAAWLFREFAQCFKGRQQLRWSQGLAERLGVKVRDAAGNLVEYELSDQQVMGLEPVPEEAAEVTRIDLALWGKIVKARARGQVLDLAVRCKHELAGFLDLLRQAPEPWDAVAKGFWFKPYYDQAMARADRRRVFYSFDQCEVDFYAEET